MKLFPANPPPGPFRSEFWRSPLRGPWLTSVLGACLLVAVPIVALTGLLSHAAYNPDLGNNRITGSPSIFDTLVFDWPTSPAWLYVATQGLHVTLGVATMPLLLAKLWSVIPKLWEWPPVRSPAHALERLTLALLVGGALFQFVTGLLNVQVYYPWKFDFVIAHYYGAWVFLAGVLPARRAQVGDGAPLPARAPGAGRAEDRPGRHAGAGAPAGRRAGRGGRRARAGGHPPRPAHDVAPRAAGAGRRQLAGPGGDDGRTGDRRAGAKAGPAGPARPGPG